MRLAVWNIQPCVELFGQPAGSAVDVRFGSPEECKKLLLDGEVDVALIPVNDALRTVEAFAILPELVLASKSSKSFSSLRLDAPLDEVKIVDVHPHHRQAGEVTEIVLREQYRLDVKFRYRETVGANGESPDAWVEFGTNVAPAHPSLDIGQEWFEMAGRPLIWGVFAIRGDRDAGDHGDALFSLADIDNLTSEGIRLRYDADVLAGLDELAHYLFYFGKVDDIPMPRFTKAPQSIQPPE